MRIYLRNKIIDIIDNGMKGRVRVSCTSETASGGAHKIFNKFKNINSKLEFRSEQWSEN